jgi:hypothetical protein
MIKNVDVADAQARQALIQTGQQVFARPEIAVRPVPHRVAGLGGDHDFVAMCVQVAAQHGAERLFGRARRRAVIVGQIEMSDSEIERPEQHVTCRFTRVHTAEIVPKAQRNRG